MTATAALDDEAIAEAYRRWQAGAPRAKVASVLGIPPRRLINQLQAGVTVLQPRRLVARDLRERFGWTRSAQSLYRRKGLLPAADGVDGARFWWWETTINQWERQSELHWCRECHHAFISPIGLKEHGTLVHL